MSEDVKEQVLKLLLQSLESLDGVLTLMLQECQLNLEEKNMEVEICQKPIQQG